MRLFFFLSVSVSVSLFWFDSMNVLLFCYFTYKQPVNSLDTPSELYVFVFHSHDRHHNCV